METRHIFAAVAITVLLLPGSALGGVSLSKSGSTQESKSSLSYSTSLSSSYDGLNSTESTINSKACSSTPPGGCTPAWITVDYTLTVSDSPSQLEFEWHLYSIDTFTPIGSKGEIKIYDHTYSRWDLVTSKSGSLGGWTLVQYPLNSDHIGSNNEIKIRTHSENSGNAENADELFLKIRDFWLYAADTDGDGIADGDDNCPSVQNFGQEDHNDDDEGDSCDDDDDGDGIIDGNDDCQLGVKGWTSNSQNDHDGDGCKDSSEDDDDDNDGLIDGLDTCDTGMTNWVAGDASYDHDGDGCHDSTEDNDDDNDGVVDVNDDCTPGEKDWSSKSGTDHDNDGCQDGGEDLDDDNDGVTDTSDDCAAGNLGWASSSATDHDTDGCHDSDEDTDDDNDGIADLVDTCPTGDLGWTSGSFTDHDTDGCQDSNEDIDDDNDGIQDSEDDCPNTAIGISVDGFGCEVDVDEDAHDNSSVANGGGTNTTIVENKTIENSSSIGTSPNQTSLNSTTDANNSEVAGDAESAELASQKQSIYQRWNLDLLGIFIAMLLPVIGIIIGRQLRSAKRRKARELIDEIRAAPTVQHLDQVYREDCRLAMFQEQIDQGQYQILTQIYEDRKTELEVQIQHAHLPHSTAQNSHPPYT